MVTGLGIVTTQSGTYGQLFCEPFSTMDRAFVILEESTNIRVCVSCCLYVERRLGPVRALIFNPHSCC